MTLFLNTRNHSITRMLWSLLLMAILGFLVSPAYGAQKNLTGKALIIGNGPEHHAIAELAAHFEKLHPFASIDFFWHPHAKPLQSVLEGEADMAITGLEAPTLPSTTIAWDGIAVVTNFANPISELTTTQLAGIFTGKLRFWSDVWEEAPQMRITPIHRAANQNIRQSFEKQLGIAGRTLISAAIIGPEVQVFKTINGEVSAISYVSMGPALQAHSDGYGVTLQFINGIEPERQTVLDGTYPLRRPIVIVTSNDPSPVTQAFIQFCLSAQGQRIIRNGPYYPLQP